MLEVDDWAEIRRLHSAEGLSIKKDRATSGRRSEHGAFGVEVGGAAELSADASRLDDRQVRAGDPTAPRGVPADARLGDPLRQPRPSRANRTGSRLGSLVKLMNWGVGRCQLLTERRRRRRRCRQREHLSGTPGLRAGSWPPRRGRFRHLPPRPGVVLRRRSRGLGGPP